MAVINIIVITTSPTLPSILDLGAIKIPGNRLYGGDNYRMQNAG